MTHNVYQAPVADLGTVHELTDQPYYTVSKLKFWVLLILTMGLYVYAWNYKHWHTIKHKDETLADIWPVARCIFSIFFVFSLFNLLHDDKFDERYKWSPNVNAFVYFVVALVTSIVSYLPTIENYPIIYALIILVGTLVPGFAMFNAQIAANIACDDEFGKTNGNFTAVNVIWMFIGILMSTATIVSIYLVQGAVE